MSRFEKWMAAMLVLLCVIYGAALLGALSETDLLDVLFGGDR